MTVLDGRDGSLEWTHVRPAGTKIMGASHPAIGELGGPPGLESVFASGDDPLRLLAFSADGALLWSSGAVRQEPIGGYSLGGAAPALADFDGDGSPEIAWANQVLRADGSYFWTPEAGGTRGANDSFSPPPETFIACPVDLDGDGRLELIAGSTAYKLDEATRTGRILWTRPDILDGYCAIGNFDADPRPELALVSRGSVHLLDAENGVSHWSRPLADYTTECGPAGNDGGPPLIADLDGDCDAEIGVAGLERYEVFEADGSLLWSAPIRDCSSYRAAATAFDLDGDGILEVIYSDELALRFLRGTDGALLAEVPTLSHTWTESPTVADVDGDGEAEVLLCWNDYWNGDGGLRVFGGGEQGWMPARATWNQHAYSVTNVNDDGTIPAVAAESWHASGTYRVQSGTGGKRGAPDLTTTVIDSNLTQAPGCAPELTVYALVANAGRKASAATVVSAWQDAAGVASEWLASDVVPALQPGEWFNVTFTVLLPLAGSTDVRIVADSDAASAELVAECSESNNTCSLAVDTGPITTLPPEPIGPALRARDHGDPHAADIVATFDWSLDLGAPRAAGHHYDLLRGTDPRSLPLLTSAHPLLSMSYVDSTPAATTLPAVQFYLVYPANACEVRSAD